MPPRGGGRFALQPGMILLFLVTAWVLGILLASWLALPAPFWLCILLLPSAYLALSIRDQGLRLPSALALLLVLGALRYQSSVPSPGPLAELNGQGPATVIGLVEAEPETGNQTLNIDLGVSRVRTDGPWRDADGRVLVQAPRDTAVGYGDQVEVYGELTTPPAGADFSYRDFLARSGVFSLLRARRLVVMQHDLGSPFLAALYGFRSRGVTALKTLFPEPSSSLLSGILLGYDREIPPEVQDAFNSTSTGHIIAISGQNRTQRGFPLRRTTP